MWKPPLAEQYQGIYQFEVQKNCTSVPSALYIEKQRVLKKWQQGCIYVSVTELVTQGGFLQKWNWQYCKEFCIMSKEVYG